MAYRPRRLFLHLSALSDDEYAVYLSALKDVLDVNDDNEGDGAMKTMSEEDELELEGREIGVREVRAWMKGRYRDVRPGDIDKILHLFSASFDPKDVLSGGQFLAALRLLMHVQKGGEVLEGNVFIQANLAASSPPRYSRNGPRTSPDPPSNDSPSIAFNTSPNPGNSNNPFTNNANSPPRLPVRRSSISHLEPRASGADPSGFTVVGRSCLEAKRLPSSSSNPFLQRSKTHAGTGRMVSRSSDGDVPLPANANEAPRVPPLPPRKPSHMVLPSSSSKPPPFPPSTSNDFSASGFTVMNRINNRSPPKTFLPLPPPPPVHPNPPTLPYAPLKSASGSTSFISPLMKQSLEASKAGSALKRAQQLAEKERVLEVIQSSKAPSRGTSADTSASRVPPPIPPLSQQQHRRPAPSPPQSTTSTASLERVASARLSPRVGSPDRMSSSASTSHHSEHQHHPERESPTTSSFPPQPPPTHPQQRRPSGGHRHTTSFHHQHQHRTARGSSPISDSLFQDTVDSTVTSSGLLGGRASSPPPAPPARRKRPESMQIGYGGYVSSLTAGSNSPFSDTAASAAAARTQHSPSRALFSPTTTAARSHSHSPSSALFTPPSSSSRLDDNNNSPNNNNNPTSSSSSSPLSFSAFQRAFTSIQSLHAKAQPALDRAKYKTEAGLLAPRRGYVRDARGRGGLLRDEPDMGNDDEEDGDGECYDDGASPTTTNDDVLGVDVDDNSDLANESAGGRSRPRARSTPGERERRERDELKMPVGQADGWAPL